MDAQKAQKILTIEIERTSAGWRMQEDGIPVEEIRKRVEIRIDSFNSEFRTAMIFAASNFSRIVANGCSKISHCKPSKSCLARV